MHAFRPAAPTTAWIRLAGTLTVALLLLAPIAGQAPQPTVRILEPQAGSFPGDPIIIRAAIEPEKTPVARLEFFGDTRLVCTVTQAPFVCEWHAGSEIRGHAIRVVAVLGGGGRVAAQITTADPGVNYSVDVTRVRLTVVVKSGDGFVRGLPRSAFRVFEDDEPQPIEYFGSVNESSLELVTAVDISDSMAGAIDQVKALVKKFLGSLREADHVRAVAFNENYFPLPATDRAGLLRDVDLLAPWGMTALYDTILRCFDLLGKQPSRLAMVIFTDGADTASQSTAAAVERRADSSDAVLYMIGQGQAIFQPGLRALCERLAQRSGGRAFFPRRIEDLGGTFDQILEELSNQYLLTYTPPREDDKWHRIKVKVAGYSDDQVRTKQGRMRESSTNK